MSNEERPEVKVHSTTPKATLLNKKVIVVLSSVALVVILWIIIMALMPPKLTGEHQSSIDQMVAKSANHMNDNAVKQLPSSYQDSAQIDRYMKGQGTNPKLQAELDALKHQQQLLLSRLKEVDQNKAPSNQMGPPRLDSNAVRSSIFFAGGAPLAQHPSGMNKLSSVKQQDTSHTPGQKTSAYEQQNDQKGKLDFLNSKPDKSIYDKASVQYPVSPDMLQAGTSIPAILQTQLVSNLPGNIVARVDQNVYDSITGTHLLIPKGSTLLGNYSSSVSYAQDQLQAKFTRLIRPDGTSITLPNEQGVNAVGTSGFEDSVNNHWGRVIGSAALMTVFNIPAVIASNQTPYSTVDANGNVISPPMGQLAGASALQSFGQSVSQVGSQVAQKSLNIQPTITIHAGYQFSVLVTKDIILPPYRMPMNYQITDTA